MKPIKNIFKKKFMRCFPFVVLYSKPINKSLSFNLLDTTWHVEASFCNKLTLWISSIQMTKYIIYHWNKMLLKKIWHDSLALTKLKYVTVKNNLVFSSFLNDDTKLIYECFTVKSQHM